jgi:ABC-2 type transport system ATP-binding protein
MGRVNHSPLASALRPIRRIRGAAIVDAMAIIEVQALAKRYGHTAAVSDVSFSVEEGEIFGILGPNGAGKTTTVECIVGLRRRDAGEIRILGVDPQRDRNTIQRNVGVQLQEAELPEKMTVAEALALFGSFYSEPADTAELMDVLDLGPKAHTYFCRLSGGQRQRLSIALALVGNPRIAVLDELTTGLDPAARRETWSLIERVRDRGVTVLLVTHFMQEAEFLCDRLAVIDHGRVTALDTPSGIVTRFGGRDQRMRFRPSRPIDDSLLNDLPEVAAVRRHGDEIELSGGGDLVSAVAAWLARNGIVAAQLRVEQASLDDAFVAMTGRTDWTENSS